MSEPDLTDAQAGRRPNRRWWLVAAVAAAAALVASLTVPASRHQWALSLFRQPTQYTALAFRYAWQLPSHSVQYMRVPLFFTVTNHEGTRFTYRYVIRETDPTMGWKTLRASAPRSLAPGATWSVDTAVNPTCITPPCRIEVSLPGHPETIDFLDSLRPPP